MAEVTMHRHSPPKPLPLEPGDRLTRGEFETRYHAMPHLKKAELIEGTVYMPAPVRVNQHGKPTRQLATWLGTYEAGTPGTTGADNTTVRLDNDNVPQPDCMLMINPACGGQTRVSRDDYLEGPPELIAEVAASSASYDLGDKLQAYRRNGVCEYVVWRVLDGQIDWFRLEAGQYERLPLNAEGCYQSQVFPGLWLDVPAMLQGDLARVLAVLQKGLASGSHQEFVRQLKEQKRES